METRDTGHTWGARPSEFLMVKADLHNLSADSGLSHSPIQQEAPRLTIGRRIGHIDQPRPDTQPREKGSRWNLGGLFKKRNSLKSSESHSEPKGGQVSAAEEARLPQRNASLQAGSPGPPLPPKNSNVFQPTMQVRPGPGQPQPVIFPQLQADLQYPEPGTQIVHGGHYYDPRWGYVRTGSYYDAQIAAMTGHERMSRQSTLSQDRSSGVHSMTRSSVHSLERTGSGLRSELSDRSHESGDTMRSWRDQKHDILRQAEVRRSLIVAEAETSGSEEEAEVRVIRRAGSVGSLGRRGRGSVRRQRRESREESDLVTSSPYIHTGHIMGHRSMSADISHTSTPPPAPPPRDPKLKHHLMSAMRGGGRPVSYSFEHLRCAPGDRPRPGHDIPPPPPGHQPRHKSQPPARATLNQLALPPRRPQHSDLHLSLQSPDSGHQMVHSTPVHHPTDPEAASLHNVVADHVPRSRRPLHYQAVTRPTPGSAASSEGIGSQTSLEDTGGHQPQSSGVSDRLGVSNGLTERLGVSNGLSQASDTNLPANSARSRLRSGKCSPASVSSKDSGCSASSDVQASVSKPPMTASGPVSSTNVAGFSTQKRRSRFEEAIKELELVYNNIADDEDLLDRAERRDLPTAHQLLIWRDREEQSSHNTSAESALSDFDNFLNWNTSSSFEHVSGLVSPISSRPRRRGVASDKVSDDMMVRRISAANKIPVTQSTMTGLGNTSYLSVSSALDNEEAGATEWEPESDEPDIRVDDVLNRNLRDANQIRVIQEPQPKFGFPLGPVTGGANSDYLHAVPDGKYRSTFNPMRNPDLVKDDLAFRHLRKDESLDDPSGLGIVKDPHGLICSPGTNWPPRAALRSPPLKCHSDNHNQITRSLSENIAQIIRKQSSKPGAKLDEIITYEDLSDPLVYDTIKYTMDLINKRKTRSDKAINKSPAKSSPTGKQGITMYELFRHHQSEPESLNTLDHEVEKEVREMDSEEEDEGVSSVSSPDFCVGSQLPDLVTGEQHAAGETEPDPENHRELVVQSCLIEQNSVDPYSDKNLDPKKSRSYISSLIEEEESRRLSIKSLSDGGSLEEDCDTEKEMELHKIQSELQQVVEKIDQSLIEGQGERNRSSENHVEIDRDREDPGVERTENTPLSPVRPKRPSEHPYEASGEMRGQFCLGLGGLTGDPGVCKLSGEPGVLRVAHPWLVVTSLFLACVHQVTGLDLLTAFSVLITVVAFVSLLIH